MAVTQNTYTGNGSTTNYSFTFPYLETTDIKVSLNGTVTTAYTLANATTIQFNTAPANGAAIRIYRQTDDAALAATFYPGSAIRSQDLNENFTQNLYVTQESTNNAATATTTANTALTNSNTAISTANAATATANTASSNASAAVATANTASSNASAAVSTANTASSNATTAVNTANAATATANSATSTANTALSTANAATSTANAASTAATNAVNTANAASSAASSAVSTANTASTNASNAVTTANTASSNATTAVNTANSAVATANSAAAAVANAVIYTIVANVAAIPASPSNNTAIEVANSTGIESFTPLAGKPGGFVGNSGLSVRIIYSTSGSTWNWVQYFPNDPEARYLKLAGGTVTGNLAVNGTLTKSGNNVVTVGDTGTVTSTMIADGTIVNADVSASAAIAGTKISPDFGSQTITTTGVVSAAAGAAGTPSIAFTGDLNTGLYSPGSDQVAIATGGTGRLFVNSDGTVSVGNASTPAGVTSLGLRVSSDTGAGQLLVLNKSNNATNAANITLNKSRGTAASPSVVLAGDTAGSIFANAYDGSTHLAIAGVQYSVDSVSGANDLSGLLTFHTRPSGVGASPQERLRITSAGLVGVGVSSPQLPLTIGLGGGANPATSGSTQSSGGIARIGSSGAAALDIGTLAAGPVWLQSTNVTNLATNYSLLLNPNGGNVGIGTTSPSGLIHLQGASIAESWYTATNAGGATWRVGTADTSSGLSGAYRIYDSTNSVTRLLINSSGYVGIDTAAPETNLDVKGSGTRMIRCITTNTSGTAVGIVRAEYLGGGGGVNASAELRAGDGYTYLVSTTNSPLLIGTAGTERARIDSSGNFGIGSSSPQAVLHVERNQAAESGIFINNSNAGGYVAVRLGNSDRGTNGDHLVYGGTVLGLRSKTGTSISFEPAGTERARIDSSGRLLVGTSSAPVVVSATAPLNVALGNEHAATFIRYSANEYGPFFALGKSRTDTKGAQAAVINGDALGNISFFGSNGSDFSNLAGSIECYVDGTPFSSGDTTDLPGRLVFSTTADGASSPTERMRIASNGFVFLHTTTAYPGSGNTAVGTMFEQPGNNGSSLFVSRVDNAPLFLNRNTDGELLRCNRSGVTVGSISVTTTATAYNTSSDYRLKENVTTVTDGITRLQQLKPSRFNFIADPTKTVDGFLAHEVQSVVPEAITGEKDAVDDDGNPVYQGIDQSKLVPLLTAALQEAIGEIESLKARVAALESA